MFKNYFKIAIRNLKRNKAISAINIFGLALGLAAFWMIALYVGDELSYDRYHANANNIYRVAQHATWDGGSFNFPVTSAPFAAALKNDYPEVEQTVRLNTEGGGTLSFADKHLQTGDILFTDNTFFKVFSYHFLYGDVASALAKPESIVLTKTLAVNLFGDYKKALNKTVTFENKVTNQVTGVIDDVPANSHFTFSALRALPNNYTDAWQSFNLYTYVLLKKGTDYKKLEAKLPGFFNKYLKKEMGELNYKMELQPLTSIHLHSNLEYEMGRNGNINYVYIFSLVAALILIIAAINYINLSTARASLRLKEVGVRKVSGSGRGQLVFMFLAESVLLILIAAIIAVALIHFALPWFQQLTGKELTLWRFGVKETVASLAIFTILTGALSGIYPALFLSNFRTIPALKGQAGNLSGNNIFRKSLVTAQFAITIAMIAGSIIIYQQLRFVSNKNLGFNKDQVLVFHIDNKTVRSQVNAVKQQLLQSPLIEAVAAAGNPIGNNDIGGRDFKVESNGKFDTKVRLAKKLAVDEDFFKTMQMKLVQGRSFSPLMPTDKDEAVIVNETLVREAGLNNAVGKRIAFGEDKKGNPLLYKIIGVVNDFHISSLQHKIEPLVMQMPPEDNDKDNLYIRISKNNIPAALQFLKKTYATFDAENRIDFHFLNENFQQQYKAEQKQGSILLIFTILAISIACMGLFGLVTFMAEQRKKEIGIRKVLGAGVAGIVTLISKDFLKLVFIALLIACPVTWASMSKWLQDFAYRINISWLVFAIAGGLAAIIALITISFKAIRAALANPVKSLRTE